MCISVFKLYFFDFFSSTGQIFMNIFVSTDGVKLGQNVYVKIGQSYEPWNLSW